MSDIHISPEGTTSNVSTAAVKLFKERVLDANTARDIIAGDTYNMVSAELQSMIEKAGPNSVMYEPFALESYILIPMKCLGCDLNSVVQLTPDGHLKIVIPEFNTIVPEYDQLAHYVFYENLGGFISNLPSNFWETEGHPLAGVVNSMVANGETARNIFDVCDKFCKDNPQLDDIGTDLTMMYAALVVLEDEY